MGRIGYGIVAATIATAATAQPQGSIAMDERERVVAEVRRTIAENYVLPERRPALDAVLAEGLRAGRYDAGDSATFAAQVDADLKRVGRDNHLGLGFDPRMAAMMKGEGAGGSPDIAGFERQVRAGNHGVRALALLPGNVRYMDLRSFDWIGPDSEAALSAAMRFLGDGAAVVIDIRRNGGGSPAAVQYIASHFLPAGKPLVTFHEGGKPMQSLAALDRLASPRMIGKPLYVLTSRSTGSAAEEFAGHVAGYKLGELIGETTSGGGFMNRLVPIDGGFVLSVSTGRSVLAATGRDWEGVGIAPTIAASPERALEVAQQRALARLAQSATGSDRARLEGLRDVMTALASDPEPAAPLPSYAGSYGVRTIAADGQGLSYRLEGRMADRLLPLGGDRFARASDPGDIVAFEMKDGRAVALLLGEAGGPPPQRHARTGERR